MRNLLVLAILAGLVPALADAGAWPREQGSGFVSVSYEYTTWQDMMSEDRLIETEGEIETFGYMALYAEYGITDRLTAGIDTGREEAPYTWSGVAFLRAGLGPAHWRNRFAAEFGLGQREIPNYGLDQGDRETIFRPGVSWGYGFDTRLGRGWTGLDLKSETRQTTGGTAYKADFTLGLDPDGPWLGFVQLQGSDYPGAGPALRVVPTLVRRITPWLAIESALLWDAYGNERMGVRAGLWLEF